MPLDDARFSKEQLDAHETMLHEKVFLTRELPHFNQLLRETRQMAEKLPAGSTVVSLERGLLYGGYSLVAPFFQDHDFISVDCSPESADERGAYNASKVDDPRFLAVATTHRGSIEATGLDDAVADLVMVPNLVHHVADQDALFAEMARIARPGGRVYAFEPLVRELHQIPDDYLRYTPFGMQRIMEKSGLTSETFELEGGPFSAIAYCWTQALEYFPEEEREAKARWFYEEHLPQLLAWDEEHVHNRVRRFTKFPMSFSVTSRKPAA